MPISRGRQFRAGMNQAFRDHGYDEISLAATLGGQDRVQAKPADGSEDRFDMAVGESLLGTEEIRRRDQGLVAKQAAEGFDLL